MTYVAGIDIGTTSVCCIIANAKTGGKVSVSVRDNDAGLPSEQGWDRTQDPDRIMAIIEELIAEQAALWPQVSAIGISCQMHGILYVDGQGKAASPLYTWQDRRGELPANGSVRSDGGEFGREEREVALTAYMEEATGHKLASGYGLVTHYYNVRNGLVPPDAAYLCTIGDYAAMKLCGRIVPLMDASNAASLGLYGLATRGFDLAAIKALGMTARLLPPLADEADIAGTTPAGQTVACAIGDNQASFLGSVPSLAHSMLANVGTGAQISIYAPSLEDVTLGEAPGQEAAPLLETRPFPGGGYLLVGASLGGGKTYALLEALFRDIHDSFAAAPLPAASLYERMNVLAEAAMRETEAPLQVSASFFGTRQDPGRTGTIAGITDRNWTAGQLTLGFLNGIAAELLAFADSFPAVLRSGVNTIAASGNGVRRNPVLRQLLQTQLGHPLYLSPIEEEAAFGAAIYAAVRSGLYPDSDAAIACFHRSDR